MGSNLGKFLQGFSDQQEDENIESTLPTQPKNGEERHESNVPKQDSIQSAGLVRPVERIKRRRSSDEPAKVESVKSPEPQQQDAVKHKPLKLNLKMAAQPQEAVPKIDPKTLQSLEEQVEHVEDSDPLELLFDKSGTPVEQREKWMLTIQKARQSNAKTMFNTKVCNGRFRFTSIGELEILPDMDTSGKTSKELLSMKWD